MTLEDLMGYQGQPITEDELKEFEECDLIKDIIDNGVSDMYPELNWYLLELINGKEINVFL